MPGRAKDAARGETQNFVRALSRGLAVLHAMSRARRPVSLSEVARDLDLDRATARRLLLTLEELSFVGQDGAKFVLTPRALELGHAYLVSTGIWEVGLQVLPGLVQEIRESASIAVLDQHEIVYLVRERVDKRMLGVGRTIGSRLPAYCTSLGRVLLAALPPEARRQAIERSATSRLTKATVVEPDQLLALLDTVQAQGFSIVDQELETGLTSIAVPVNDQGGRVVAALNVSTQTSSFKAHQLQGRFLEPLQKASAEISARLGQLL